MNDDKSYLSKITTVLSTVTFERHLDSNPGVDSAIQCGHLKAVKCGDDNSCELLDFLRRQVVGELELYFGFRVHQVAEMQACSWQMDSIGDRTRADLGAQFWEGQKRIDYVKVVVEIVGDVADKLREASESPRFTNGYQLGNTCVYERQVDHAKP